MANTQCIANDRLNLFLNDQVPPAEKEEIELHLRSCEACRHQLASAYRMAQPEPASTRAPRRLVARVLRQPQPSWSRWFDWMFDFRLTAATTAALLLLVGGASFLYWRASQRLQPALVADRFRQTAPISFAPQLLAPENAAQMGAGPGEFRWSKVAGASRYEFTLLDRRGNSVWQVSTTEERVALGSFSDRLQRGQTYFWSVAARMPDGTKADSEIRKFVR